jgi:hypothetical protein
MLGRVASIIDADRQGARRTIPLPGAIDDGRCEARRPESRNAVHVAARRRARESGVPAAVQVLLLPVAMILARCVVRHRRFLGAWTAFRIVSWRGAGLVRTEGVCRGCQRRWRAESRRAPLALSAPAIIPAWMPRAGLAAAVFVAVVLAARPVDRAPGGSATDGAGSRAVAVALAGGARVAPAARPARPEARVGSRGAWRRPAGVSAACRGTTVSGVAARPVMRPHAGAPPPAAHCTGGAPRVASAESSARIEAP